MHADCKPPEQSGEVAVLSDFQRRPGRTQVGSILQVVSNLPMIHVAPVDGLNLDRRNI
jgi:hypothetical protein